MRLTRTLAISIVTSAAILGIGWLSRAPYHQPDAAEGMLRLSWRLLPERKETCRARTPSELEALPVHMRTAEICDGHLVTYLLVLQIDDTPAETTRVVPGGARADRPLFVLREIPLQPGRHRVRLQFGREAAPGTAPDPLAIDTMLVAAPGAIELITIDAAARRFRHLNPDTR